ncbi:MAG: DNA translocase FtsK 4TM domain-containing protein [Longimicrobiales bacterium]
MLSSQKRRHLLGILLLSLGGFVALALVPLPSTGTLARWFPMGNVMGWLGSVATAGGFSLLGAGYLMVPAFLVVAGAACFAWIGRRRATRLAALFTGLIVLLPALGALFAADSGVDLIALLPPDAAGTLGRTVAVPIAGLIGGPGTLLFLALLVIVLFVATIGWNPAGAAVAGGAGALQAAREKFARDETPVTPVVVPDDDEPAQTPVAAEVPIPAAVTAVPALLSDARKLLKRKDAKPPVVVPVLEDTGNPESGDLPPLSLLSVPPQNESSLSDTELDRLAALLISTLKTFKVEGEIAGRTTGPVVTQFEVVPAPGVKVNRISALDADLALAMRAASIRIVAPIPGKGAVGIEVPNPEPEVVYLRRILETSSFQRARGSLPLALGKDLTGKPYVADLARMPHLLIAGATGSGKSICINTLITSLIYKHSPQTLRLLMVDPKMVELSIYADLPHLRHPVVTDPQDAATVLKWAVLEMERRYELLSVNGARALSEFNTRAAEGAPLKRAHAHGEDYDPDRWRYKDGPLPYIVVIIDELADLMLSVQAEIEKPLAQLAQKARAIGIHLIVATQRPSVNVITGLIKANFPCRIGFRVASKVDSRTILDQNGADALLGNGDMLFLPPGTSDPVRIQGAYLSTEDTEQVMDWYRALQASRPLEDDILQEVRSREAASAEDDGGIGIFEERDPLFVQAAELCIQHKQGSTSLLQRRLRVGYGRAARIIDQLHTAGILGPADGSRPREVLIGMESLENIVRND